MDWSLEPRALATRLLAAGVYLAAVALFLLFQEIGLRLRREEHRAWWAGNGRDLLNAAGVVAIGGSLRLFGFPAAAALLLGATLTLVLFGEYIFLVTQTEARRPRAWAVALGLAAAVPLLVWPEAFLSASGSLLTRLFSPGMR